MTSTNNGVAELPSEKVMDKHVDLERDSETSSVSKGDLLSLEHVDPVLNAKMSLINDVGWHLASYQANWTCFADPSRPADH